MYSLLEKIRHSVIGEGRLISTPFGSKPLVYADYTASGRSLSFIEDYIRDQVLPYYANTHTETSYTGAQTTRFREDARDMIRQAVDAREDDNVLFCGPGATAAIHKLIDILNIRLPADLDARYQLEALIPQEERPVVFIGPYEHHSNELPWRESIAEVVVIPLNGAGELDLAALEHQLQQYQHRPCKIGSFSAASNVTGLETPVDQVSRILKQHDALAFWDYAAAAPYTEIRMRGADGDAPKDAVFISPHKFVGGPGTPGVLIVNQQVLKNSIPAVPGGGTVSYVTPGHHTYIQHAERREEGGTPAIVESIRAGLVFRLQQMVGTSQIRQLESDFVGTALQRWSSNPNIEILGSQQAKRLSIVSLRIKHHGKDLHYGFVVALLNDLFGIQVRGGCSCAGPYAHRLLNMSPEYSNAIEGCINQGEMVMRPGWVRLNFNYFIDQESFEYLVQAIDLVAEHGWKMLPAYQFDKASGVWRYQNQPNPPQNDLTSFDPLADQLPAAETATKPLTEYLKEGETLMFNTVQEQSAPLELSAEAEKLRWFVLPQEI